MTKKLSRLAPHLVLIVLAFSAVFPLYWMFISSLKGSTEILGFDLIAAQPTLKNYIDAFTTVPLFKMLFNSVIVSLGTALVQLIVAVLFAYAFMRWNFKGKNLVYGILSITWLIPIQAIMIPNYVEVINMGINNTLLAMIIPHCCSVFANISMYQNFNSMPRALIEAARMDGSSELQILKDIVMPNMKSSIASLGIVLVITAWNDYLWPTLVARTEDVKPIQIGLKSFSGSDTYMWGASMAAATISTIPILVVYIFMNRRIISSFMKGGIK